jgi:hypothetical protein
MSALRARLLRLSVIATLGFAALGASPVNAAASTTFNVPCGNIKLLETAVGTPGSTVNLAKGCKYQLTDIVVNDYAFSVDELPIVTGSVTINGHGATLLGIPFNSNQYQGTFTCCGRILEVGTSGSPGYLTLNSVTITQGFFISAGAGFGGGLAVNFGSTAILNGSVVKNNSADLGGGIENNGTLKLNGSRVLGNSSGSGGGGIFSFGILSITNDSQVNGNIANRGGGIYAGGNPTTTTIADSSVSGNRAVEQGGNGLSAIGGGIGIMSGGTLTLLNVTVRGNSVSNTSGDNQNAVGGGIAVFYNSVVVIDHSQIRNNTASLVDPIAAAEGAGLYNNGGTVSFVGGAIEFNAATNSGGGTADGGGIFNASGTITQTGTTVTSNTPDNWS